MVLRPRAAGGICGGHERRSGVVAGATWVVDDDGGAGCMGVQAAAGVDRVHSTCASICAGLYACSKKRFQRHAKRLIATQSGFGTILFD